MINITAKPQEGTPERQDFMEYASIQAEILGGFKNEAGCEFVFYTPNIRSLHHNEVFITGDELCWEEGWIFSPDTNVLVKKFLMGKKEMEQAREIYAEFTRLGSGAI